MTLILLRQITRMLKVARLPTHPDSGIQVKRQFIRIFPIRIGDFPPRLGFDEAIEAGDVFQFGVGVEEEGGMVCVCQA